MRLFCLAILMAGILGMVASCATHISASTPCPEVPEYSKAFQGDAADQLEGLPDGSPLVIMIEDYKRMRDGCRVKP